MGKDNNIPVVDNLIGSMGSCDKCKRVRINSCLCETEFFKAKPQASPPSQIIKNYGHYGNKTYEISCDGCGKKFYPQEYKTTSCVDCRDKSKDDKTTPNNNDKVASMLNFFQESATVGTNNTKKCSCSAMFRTLENVDKCFRCRFMS